MRYFLSSFLYLLCVLTESVTSFVIKKGTKRHAITITITSGIIIIIIIAVAIKFKKPIEESVKYKEGELRCPECSAFIHKNESICPECGAKIRRDIGEPDEEEEIDLDIKQTGGCQSITATSAQFILLLQERNGILCLFCGERAQLYLKL